MKKLFTLFAALLCAASMVQVQAKEFDASYSVLTVYEGSETNVYVPYYGFYADAFMRSQYVVPASELTAMKNHSIIGLGYFLQEPASYDWNSTVQVRLKEVNYTSISDFEDMEGVEAVYEGTLSSNENLNMIITFDRPFTYRGGNLLVEFSNVKEGTYAGCTFYGQAVDGASVSGYSYSAFASISATQRNFIPQTTFFYDPEKVPGESMAPIVEEDGWVHYDNGEYESAAGTGGGLFYWGIMIPAGTVSDTYLTRVAIGVAYRGNVTVYIYQGGSTPSEGQLLHSQEVSLTAEDAYQEITLMPSVQVDPSQDLWIIFGNTGYLSYPAAYSKVENAPNGRWLGMLDAEGNIVWDDVEERLSKPVAWMIRGLFGSAPEYHPYLINLEANDISATSANITWEGFEKFDLKYNKLIPQINSGFEDGLGEWTAFDADGDGNNWIWTAEDPSGYDPVAHSGEHAVFSESYRDYVAAFDPDNWLISPRVELGGVMSFYYAAANKSYPDHFGVYVSTTGISTSDFTLVKEFDANSDDYICANVSLEEFSGFGYVAFRHFNCEDMYRFYIDDVTIYSLDDEEHAVTNISKKSYELTDLEPETTYMVQVRGKYDGEHTEWSAVTFTTLTKEEAVDNIMANPSSESRKVLREGQLMIESNGKLYNAQGAKVK